MKPPATLWVVVTAEVPDHMEDNTYHSMAVDVIEAMAAPRRITNREGEELFVVHPKLKEVKWGVKRPSDDPTLPGLE